MTDAQEKVQDYRERARVHAEVITKSIEQNELNQSHCNQQKIEKRAKLDNLKAEIEKIEIPEAPDNSKIKELKRMLQASLEHNQSLSKQRDSLHSEEVSVTSQASTPIQVDEKTPEFVKIQKEIKQISDQIVNLKYKSYTGPVYLEEFESKILEIRSKQQANCNQITKLNNEKITDSDFCSNCGQTVTEEHHKHIS